MEAIIPLEFVVPSIIIVVQGKLGDMESLEKRLLALQKLMEARELSICARIVVERR